MNTKFKTTWINLYKKNIRKISRDRQSYKRLHGNISRDFWTNPRRLLWVVGGNPGRIYEKTLKKFEGNCMSFSRKLWRDCCRNYWEKYCKSFWRNSCLNICKICEKAPRDIPEEIRMALLEFLKETFEKKILGGIFEASLK